MTRRDGKENSKMREMTGNGWPRRKGNKMEIREQNKREKKRRKM